MSDTPFSAESNPSGPPEGATAEVEVGLAAFLPDGVELASADDEPEVPVAAASSLDVEALTQIERDLDAVDAAIAAIDEGTYGVRQATGERIDDELLAQDPTRLS